MLGNWTLAHPEWLYALAALPLVFWLRQFRRVLAWVIPYASRWRGGSRWGSHRLTLVMSSLAFLLFIGALARPQVVEQRRETQVQGYDLMLVLDLSSSMLSVDGWSNNPRIAPNRLQIVKPVVERFINERPSDRIGVVIFAGEAFTLSPLTSDHDWLRQQLGRMKVGLVSHASTAIGDALALALSRLEQDDRTSGGRRLGAFVILLTDGENNAGVLDPLDAAKIAEKRGIPVFPIAAGSNEFWAPDYRDGQVRAYRRSRGKTDFSALEKIAERTGGVYLRARDQGAVSRAFDAINQAQQLEFDSIDYRLTEERFAWLAVPGGLCLLLAAGLPGIPWRRKEGMP